MSPSRLTPAICSAILFALLSAPLMAQGENPSIRLTSAAGAAFETDESSIALEGSAVAAEGLANVHWVNQFGMRGRGTWSASAQHTATWAIAEIPLRLGVNLLAVTVVDAANRSATLHMAVNRKPALGAAAAQALKIGTGIWQNRPIVYQLWRGHRVVEGDIILDPASSSEAAGAQKSVAKSEINPDGLGISYTSQLWPLVGPVHNVPYVRTDNNVALTAAISAFNSAFGGLIQFVPHSGESNYVNITVEAGGSGEGFSDVGISSIQPNTLDCGDGCTEATWLHEMGHTLGLLHEHQRPDRDTYITLNLANADLPNVPGNFTLFSFDYQTLGLYDYASVMHYGPFGFSKAGLPVIESIPAGIPLSNDTGYSDGDIDQIERLYGAAPANVTVTTNPAGLQIIVDGTTYPAPHSFSFALNSSHSLNLPPDPQNTNPADGSAYGFGNWSDKKARLHSVVIKPGAGTLTAPAAVPAVTVYEANFVRFQPFAFTSPATFPSDAGTVHVAPAPNAKFGGSYFTDRTLVKVSVTKNAGFAFYGWFGIPYPFSSSPKSFYIQSPTTAAEARLVPTTGTGASSVTIVGESITGANTWNPGLSGLVDGTFELLPMGFSLFYNDSTWGPLTHHTVSVEQTQSPVTTNVYYNFNSWSDGKAISHGFTQPTTGAKNITASYTPFYASYTVPPPLGSQFANCAGGVATSPAGVVYPINNAFLFYEDGTSAVTTATANSGMVFAGWSGSLTGTTNPQPTTIQDQFVPTANFNLIATPLTVTGFTPATATARATALNVTINGTGFTTSPTPSFVNWNGSRRTATFVSSTQLTLQLNAGDLINPGGQDVFVGNNNAGNTCGVGAEASFPVKPAP
jgi:Astacin (Peptidase family M12A)/Divergent InlB B-repeat domain/IPT/TIG domain